MTCERIVGEGFFVLHRFEQYDPLTDTYTLLSPDTVVARLRSPAGAVSNPTPTELAEGIWRVGPIILTSKGKWRYTMESSGQLEMVDNRYFEAVGQLVPA